ncbi:MAG: sugar kinase [Candidatus Roseilinea sp.]|nr:MAG: sugar kinase [Candidatus Roseilinea sp.]
MDEKSPARNDRFPCSHPIPAGPSKTLRLYGARFQEVVCELTAHSSGRVIALSIGAQAGSIIPADAFGQPIYPMITFLDTRATDIVHAWVRHGWGEVIREITGWGLQIGQPLASIAWLREHRPDIFTAARRFIGPHDDLVRRLTGTLVSNASCGAQIPLIERRTGEWSMAVAERVGLSRDHLAPLGASGSIVGAVQPEVADALNLPRSTLIVNGGQDHACEALALGLTEPGSLMLATGTAWVITGIADSPEIAGIPRQMDLNAHVVPQRWTISTYMGGFGAVVEWWLSTTSADLDDRYALLQHALEASPPGSNSVRFLPESQHRPASQFSGLKLSHRWDDLTRAVVEGIASEVCAAIAALRMANLPVNALYMLGGAARTSGWSRVLADMTGVTIHACDDSFLGARGAAILAGLGAGAYSSAAQAWPHFTPRTHLTEPDPQAHAHYRQIFTPDT